MDGVVALPESVREDSECNVTQSSFSTFSADWIIRGGLVEESKE